jgi:hypothetical protein
LLPFGFLKNFRDEIKVRRVLLRRKDDLVGEPDERVGHLAVAIDHREQRLVVLELQRRQRSIGARRFGRRRESRRQYRRRCVLLEWRRHERRRRRRRRRRRLTRPARRRRARRRRRCRRREVRHQ